MVPDSANQAASFPLVVAERPAGDFFPADGSQNWLQPILDSCVSFTALRCIRSVAVGDLRLSCLVRLIGHAVRELRKVHVWLIPILVCPVAFTDHGVSRRRQAYDSYVAQSVRCRQTSSRAVSWRYLMATKGK